MTNRVLIISDHPIFAEAITRLLQEEEISVVAKANNFVEARSILLDTREIEASLWIMTTPNYRTPKWYRS